MRRLSAHYIPFGGVLYSGSVITVEDGVVVEVALECENIDSLAFVEFYSGVLIPPPYDVWECGANIDEVAARIDGFVVGGSGEVALLEGVDWKARRVVSEFTIEKL